MDLNKLKERINGNDKLKHAIHWMLISPRRTMPRLWVKLLLNPFFSSRGRGSVVKLSARLNVTPINRFVLGARSVIENRCTIDNGVGDVVIGAGSVVIRFVQENCVCAGVPARIIKYYDQAAGTMFLGQPFNNRKP